MNSFHLWSQALSARPKNAVWKAWAHRANRFSLSLLFLVRKLMSCQYAPPNQSVQRNTWSAEAFQYPRVPHTPFQINTRVRLARRDPPSAQTERTENKCRSPKQINPCAIQGSPARRDPVGDGSTGREKTRFILAKGKHGDRPLNIWVEWRGFTEYIVNRKVIRRKVKARSFEEINDSDTACCVRLGNRRNWAAVVSVNLIQRSHLQGQCLTILHDKWNMVFQLKRRPSDYVFGCIIFINIVGTINHGSFL